MRKSSLLSREFLGSETAIIVYFALLKLMLHVLTSSQYGFFRDELAFIDDAKHLAWGYVDHPPLSPFMVSLAHQLFGDSLIGYRFFFAVIGASTVALTGLMARTLGGGRFPQMLAMGAVIIAPFYLGSNTIFHVVPVDQFLWVLACYLLVRLLKTGNAKLWIAIGAVIGLGVMNKYTIAFFTLGLCAALLLTPNRNYLKSKWLWLGGLVAVLICLPNLYWQVTHHWVSLDYLGTINARDVMIGRTSSFLSDQFIMSAHPFTVPIWLIGLYFLLFSKQGQPYRLLGWLYMVTLGVLIILKGRGYYLAPLYPMLLAAGAVAVDQVIQQRGWKWARPAIASALAIGGIIIVPLALPIIPINTALWPLANGMNETYREMLGWHELTDAVATAYHALPPEQQAQTVILTGNYGEAGAVNLYGPDHGLPTAISPINSYYYWSQGKTNAETYIVVGYPKQDLFRIFRDVTPVGTVTNPYGVENEENTWYDHGTVYLCKNPHLPLDQIWPMLKHYG